jgi:hypothetical protein
METKEHYEWNTPKRRALEKLIMWYDGLPPGTEVRIAQINSVLPVENILVWLGGQMLKRDYNALERDILNDLVQVRKEWMYDTIGA